MSASVSASGSPFKRPRRNVRTVGRGLRACIPASGDGGEDPSFEAPRLGFDDPRDPGQDGSTMRTAPRRPLPARRNGFLGRRARRRLDREDDLGQAHARRGRPEEQRQGERLGRRHARREDGQGLLDDLGEGHHDAVLGARPSRRRGQERPSRDPARRQVVEDRVVWTRRRSRSQPWQPRPSPTTSTCTLARTSTAPFAASSIWAPDAVRTRRTAAIALTLLGAVVLLAGCGGKEAESDATSATTAKPITTPKPNRIKVVSATLTAPRRSRRAPPAQTAPRRSRSTCAPAGRAGRSPSAGSTSRSRRTSTRARAGKVGEVVIPLGDTFSRKGCVLSVPRALRAVAAAPGRLLRRRAHDEVHPGRRARPAPRAPPPDAALRPGAGLRDARSRFEIPPACFLAFRQVCRTLPGRSEVGWPSLSHS